MVVVPVCLNGRCCSSGCVGIVCNDCHGCPDEDIGGESLPILAFRRDFVNAIFLEYSKEGKLSPTHIGIQNIPSDVCYDDTKHCEMQSERRRIQNLFRHLRWSVLTQTVNGLTSLTGRAKTLHLRCFEKILNMLLLKSKASVRCPKKTLDAAK